LALNGKSEKSIQEKSEWKKSRKPMDGLKENSGHGTDIKTEAERFRAQLKSRLKRVRAMSEIFCEKTGQNAPPRLKSRLAAMADPIERHGKEFWIVSIGGGLESQVLGVYSWRR